MKYILIIFIFCVCFKSDIVGQQQPSKPVRIVDTLTSQEKTNRNPVLLRTELDSLVQLHLSTLPQKAEVPVQERSEVELGFSAPVVIGAAIFLLLITTVLLLLLKRQKKLIRSSIATKLQLKEISQAMSNPESTVMTEKQARQKAALEKKIDELTAELEKQRLSGKSALEDYQSIKETIAAIYKIRNYPGIEQKSGEGEMVKTLLQTERSVASYAFEKFLKPIMSIVDSNKNNPARMSKEDNDRLIDLLVSLSLFYIEYLYLRIDELSVGGHIVERIGSHAKGNGIDPALLKQLNKDHGSRALALRIALDKKGIGALSYPVFDETNLNQG